MKHRYWYTFFGLVMGIATSLNWLLWRAFSTHKSWWMQWLKSELGHYQSEYVLLTLAAISVFALAGYLLGWRSDNLLTKSQHIEDHNLTLSQLATTDELTGLFNLRYINERLDEEIENAYVSPLSCLLIDIDHFKKINDRFGHPFGDQVLIRVSKLLKKHVRLIDTVGRLGGEEFIIIISNTPKERALVIADRIRESVQNEDFGFEDKKERVTVSIGVVTYPSEGLRTKESLFQAVDEALYKAKRSGRNRVVVW